MAFPHDGKKFQAGESGNPDGRPAGTKNRSTIIKKWLEVQTKVKNPETGKDEAATVEDKVWLAALNKAIKTGDINVVREIMDSAYGKASQSVDMTTKGEKLPGTIMFLSAERLTDEQIEKIVNQDAGDNDEGI